MAIVCTKPGVVKVEDPNKLYTGICRTCGAKYTALISDLTVTWQFTYKYYVAGCQEPGCGATVCFWDWEFVEN